MATHYKNIVGTGFDQYVQDQLNKRSNIGEDNTARSKYLPYLTNRNTWYRLSSSATMTDKKVPEKVIGYDIFKIDEYNEKNKKREDDYNASFTDKLAKENVLQGGIVTSDGKNQTTIRKGFAETYSKGSTDDLGLQPMPGITGITIGTGGKWQTLMQADIEFICYNLDQLNTMSKLYMSLGVTCLLEWGHIPYLTNSKEGDLENNPTNIEFFPNDKNKIGKQKLLKDITKKRKNTDGNYDAFLGTVYNFSYTADKDGAYLCKTQLMGAGGMVESLKINSSYNLDFTNPELGNDAEKYTSTLDNVLYALKEFLEVAADRIAAIQVQAVRKGASSDSSARYNEVEKPFSKIGKNTFFQELSTLSQQYSKSNVTYKTSKPLGTWGHLLNRIYGEGSYNPCKFNNLAENHNIGSIEFKNDFAKYGNATQMITGRAEIDKNGDLCDGLLPLDINFFSGYVGQWQNDKESNYNSYIKLGHLLALINQLGVFVESTTNNVKDNNKISPVVYIDYHPDNTLMDVGPVVASINPNTCLVPFIDNWGYEGYFDPLNINQPKESWWEEKSAGGYKNRNLSKPIIDNENINRVNPQYEPGEFQVDPGDPSSGGKLMNVLINLDFARETLKSSTDSDGNVSLIEYINKILNGVNKSLGGINNFRTFIDECGMIVRIVDEKLLKPLKPDDPRLLTINTFGTNSIVYDSSYSSAITPKLASQIVIATQAATSNGIKDFTEDVLSYQKLNQNVKDRFSPYKFPPLLTSKQKEAIKNSADLQLATQLKSLLRLYNQLYYNYTNKESSDTSNNVCSNLENTYKSLQNQTSKTNNTNTKKKKNNSSVLIPLEYSITLDGISGVLPYNAFKIPNNRLPEIYKDRVAFAVFSINHSFENNNWYTTLRGQTILLDIDKKVVAPPINTNGEDDTEIKLNLKENWNEGKNIYFPNPNLNKDITQILKVTPVWENHPLYLNNNNTPLKAYEVYVDIDWTASSGIKSRIGFGSETITRGGKVINARKGDKITRKEALDDLERIMTTITKPYVVGKLQERNIDYDKLDIRMQVIILDIAYNYGGNHKTLYNTFVAAIKKGKQGLIDELQRRADLGGGQVTTRREREIDYLLNGTV